MIDLKRGAASPKHICLSAVEFSIINTTTHLENHLKCDASHAPNATVF